MKTLVCPTCGCSLVRLGISKDEAVAHSYESKEYFFCCDGCLENSSPILRNTCTKPAG